jgi:flavin reductase (DIM6/NTAB) family NADH-FMN oxidoreductase RutF
MAKKVLGPGIAPCMPLWLISCGDQRGNKNAMVVALCGMMSLKPLSAFAGIKYNEFSHDIIEATREFVVNIPTVDIARAFDFCGTRSGREVKNKIQEAGFTSAPATKVSAPLIVESPINLECKVMRDIRFDSHHVFIGEVVATHVEEALLTENNKIRRDRLKTFVGLYGDFATKYAVPQEEAGHHGFSMKEL